MFCLLWEIQGKSKMWPLWDFYVMNTSDWNSHGASRVCTEKGITAGWGSECWETALFDCSPLSTNTLRCLTWNLSLLAPTSAFLEPYPHQLNQNLCRQDLGMGLCRWLNVQPGVRTIIALSLLLLAWYHYQELGSPYSRQSFNMRKLRLGKYERL